MPSSELLAFTRRSRRPRSATPCTGGRCRRLLGSLLVACALVCASAPALAIPPDEDPVALYQRAVELMDRKQYAEAAPLFKKSFALRPSYDSGANGGHVMAELGRNAEALGMLRYALRHLPPSMDPSEREYAENRIRQRIDEIMPRVCALTMSVSPAGAEVFVDGASFGRAPLAEAIYVEPGARRVLATMVGHADAERSFQAEAGEARALEIALTPLASAPEPVAPPAQKLGEHAGPEPAIWGTGTSLAAGGTVAGVALLAVSAARAADVEQQRTELGGGNACGAGTPFAAACADLEGASAAKYTLRAAGVATLASAGALGLATLVYGLWPREDDGEGRAYWAPVVTPNGVAIAGAF